jgi:hypothetical protein
LAVAFLALYSSNFEPFGGETSAIPEVREVPEIDWITGPNIADTRTPLTPEHR